MKIVFGSKSSPTRTVRDFKLVIDHTMGELNYATFKAQEKLEIGAPFPLYFQGRRIFNGFIGERSFDFRTNEWRYTAFEKNSLVLKKVIPKARFYNMYPGEIIAWMWRYVVNPERPIVPFKGWLPLGVVEPQKRISSDVNNIFDNYSLVWEMGVSRFGQPYSSLLSKTLVYTNWPSLSIKTDYGSGTTGVIVRWDFKEDGVHEYYMRPSKNTWESNWTPGSVLKRALVIKLKDTSEWFYMGTEIVLPSALETNASEAYSDHLLISYPSMAYIPCRIYTDGTKFFGAFQNKDNTAILFYYGGDTQDGNSIYTVPAAVYKYQIPSSLAGSYREEYVVVNQGKYFIELNNLDGDDTISLYIDEDLVGLADAGERPFFTKDLTKGKHKIKISVGANYTKETSYVWIKSAVGRSSIDATFEWISEDDIGTFINEMGMLNTSIFFVKKEDAVGGDYSGEVVSVWFDGIYNNTLDEMVRDMEATSREIRSVLSDIAMLGYSFQWKRAYPIAIRSNTLPVYVIHGGNIIDADVSASYDNYISMVKVYGSSKDIVGVASLTNPPVTKELVLTIPWVTSSEEAERIAKLILERYSKLNEIGRIVFSGLYLSLIEPSRIIVDHPLFTNTPLVVTKVEFDFSNQTTTVYVDLPLSSFIDFLRKMYERMNIDVEYVCERGCQTQCQVDCLNMKEMVSCDPDCQSGCEGSCEVDCQTACERPSACEEKCELSCEDYCQEHCLTVCQIECEDKCESLCQQWCEIDCQNTCESTCQSSCENSCQASTECPDCEVYCQLPSEPQ